MAWSIFGSLIDSISHYSADDAAKDGSNYVVAVFLRRRRRITFLPGLGKTLFHLVSRGAHGDPTSRHAQTRGNGYADFKKKIRELGLIAFTVASRLEPLAGATPCLSDGTL